MREAQEQKLNALSSFGKTRLGFLSRRLGTGTFLVYTAYGDLPPATAYFSLSLPLSGHIHKNSLSTG